MANETILVVDDAPVNLKLTNILLRREGYKVHATSDAEQALTLLRSLHPDLILVDVQLPGMNGLELTRRVKQDARTRDIVVVALTACAMKGDDDRAFEAGCDGYITKPIETLTLAKRVREYLEVRRTPTPPEEVPVVEEVKGFPGGLTLSPSELESVRRRFLEEAVPVCQQMLENLDRQSDIPEAIRMVHDWVEAAHALDYPVLAILACEAEKRLRQRPPDPVLLCDALSNLMLGFVEPPEASMGPLPPTVEANLKGKSVALVGFSDELARRMSDALERASAKPRLFEATTVPEAEIMKAANLVVVHVRPETFNSQWLHPATVTEMRQPLVIVGFRDHLLDIDAGILPRASELIMDGWQPEEALIRLSHAVARHTLLSMPTPPPALPPIPPIPITDGMNGAGKARVNGDAEVLLADDDLTVRVLVRSIIQGAGIKCRMASDGNEALQTIRECRPPVVVLDVNMPGIDGYEVLAATRQDRLPVRIILLTARQAEADITRGFKLGADDYVVKPFNPSELLARVKRYL